MHAGTYRNSSKLGQLALIWGFAASTLLFNGCTSAGYRKSDAAANSLQSAAAEVQAESGAIDATLASLKDLVNDPGSDLKRPYQRFSTSLAHLTAAAERTEHTGKRMTERGNAYFQAWEKQLATIDYEHIRDLSQARKSEVSQRFEAVRQRYQESQQAVQPLIAYLADIHKAIGADLTSSGLQSMKGVVQNADTNAAKVQVALKVLVTELTNSGTQLSSLALQNVETPP